MPHSARCHIAGTRQETYFEGFYDLIIVVVFIKLGYIKYEVTAFGFMTTLSIFLNFWRWVDVQSVCGGACVCVWISRPSFVPWSTMSSIVAVHDMRGAGDGDLMPP